LKEKRRKKVKENRAGKIEIQKQATTTTIAQ
jgi:hypothetical protein